MSVGVELQSARQAAVQFLNRTMPIPGALSCVGLILLCDRPLRLVPAMALYFAFNSSLIAALRWALRKRRDPLGTFDRLHGPLRVLCNAPLHAAIVYQAFGTPGAWLIGVPMVSVAPALLRGPLRVFLGQTLLILAALLPHALHRAPLTDLGLGASILTTAGILSAGLVASFQRVAQAARVAEKAKSEFLANMSHEIRTPLNGVLGTLELLSRHSEDEESRQLARVGRKSALGLLALLNDILDYSKIEAGKLTVELSVIKTQELVSSLRGEFGLREDGQLVNFVIAEGFPRAVLGDFTRILQVLRNFVSNAVKFSEGKEVLVHLSSSQSQTGPMQRFSVRDRGIGMTREQIERVFQKFEQAEAHTTRRFGGTGLGLAIARNLAEKMGGHIEVQSHPGEGSTFTLVLHLEVTDAPESVGSVASLEAIEAAPTPDQGMRILVVDDNRTNRMIAEKLLKSLGHKAVAVDSAQSALDSYLSSSFDAILMDCQMPEVDGFEATRRIRALDEYDGEPIIALTASAFAEDRARCLEAGMVDFLSKPVARGDLQKALEHAVRAPRSQPTEQFRSESIKAARK